MVDLEKYYNKRVNKLNSNAHLLQVGHSINGAVISQQDVRAIVKDIMSGLSLHLDDNLLDLCCGNGVFTYELSKYCRSITAVDISQELISVAIENYSGDNIEYKKTDVYNLNSDLGETQLINKVMMFAALQHFSKSDFPALLDSVFSLNENITTLFLGFVTDHNYKWKFHNTFKKKIFYLYRKIFNVDKMGTWWDKCLIEETCLSMNLNCKFHQLRRGNYGYPYRFHCTISNEKKNS